MSLTSVVTKKGSRASSQMKNELCSVLTKHQCLARFIHKRFRIQEPTSLCSWDAKVVRRLGAIFLMNHWERDLPCRPAKIGRTFFYALDCWRDALSIWEGLLLDQARTQIMLDLHVSRISYWIFSNVEVRLVPLATHDCNGFWPDSNRFNWLLTELYGIWLKTAWSPPRADLQRCQFCCEPRTVPQTVLVAQRSKLSMGLSIVPWLSHWWSFLLAHCRVARRFQGRLLSTTCMGGTGSKNLCRISDGSAQNNIHFCVLPAMQHPARSNYCALTSKYWEELKCKCNNFIVNSENIEKCKSNRPGVRKEVPFLITPRKWILKPLRSASVSGMFGFCFSKPIKGCV